jgi:hypothetical protein
LVQIILILQNQIYPQFTLTSHLNKRAFENPENKEFFKGVIDGIDNKDINWKKLSAVK